jgi:thymidylate kinase
MNGNLFVFEGANGVGKTSIIDLIYNEFIKKKILVKKIGFPGFEEGTLGHLIYNIHNRPYFYNVNSIDPTSLQLLHIAAHVDSINRTIIPALKSSTVILLDRYWWSTYVYGKISGIEDIVLNQMIEIEKKYWNGVLPSKLFLINRINKPLKDGINIKTWNIIKGEYNILSAIEKSHYPVAEIENETTLEVTMSHVLKEIMKSIY